jgi:hypothetical protein
VGCAPVGISLMMGGTQLHTRESLVLFFVVFADVLFRYTQLHYWFRCTFPVWSHWSAKLTRKGRVLQSIRKTLRASALVALVAGLSWLHKNPQQKVQLVQSVLAGKEWLFSAVRQLSSR